MVSLLKTSPRFHALGGYIFNVNATNFHDQLRLLKAIFLRAANFLSPKRLEEYLERSIVVRHRYGPYFLIRPNTPDLYHIAIEESYELKKWFLPLAKGVVVDVGAYIGKYTVFACGSAERVVAIEPLPLNFLSLQANVELNNYKKQVVLVNSAIGKVKGKARMYIPLLGIHQLGLEAAYIAHDVRKEECKQSLIVPMNTLDGIIEDLGIQRVDFMKIDIEGHVMNSLPGMLNTLKKTRWLFVELLGGDISACKQLKALGFSLKARHGKNFLFKNVVDRVENNNWRFNCRVYQ